MSIELRKEKMIEILELFSTVETHNLCKKLISKYVEDYFSYKPNSYFNIILYENTKIKIEYNMKLTSYILFIEKSIDGVNHATHYLFNPGYHDTFDYKDIVNRMVKLIV